MITTAVTTADVSPWVTVEEHAVIDVNGGTGMYNVVRYGDGVSVLAVSGEDLYLIREHKYAVGRHLLQLPSAAWTTAKSPLSAAKRDVLEESGLSTDTWTSLGVVHPYPTNIASAVHLFVAHDVRVVGRPEPGIELLRTSRSAVLGLVADNAITHAASLACLLTFLIFEDPCLRPAQRPNS